MANKMTYTAPCDKCGEVFTEDTQSKLDKHFITIGFMFHSGYNYDLSSSQYYRSKLQNEIQKVSLCSKCAKTLGVVLRKDQAIAVQAADEPPTIEDLIAGIISVEMDNRGL